MPAQLVQVVRVGPRADGPFIWRRIPRVRPVARGSLYPSGYLLALACALAGYAMLGKGFAYVGLPPLFIGELLLLAGAGALLLRGGWFGLFHMPQITGLTLFIAWGVYRTFPYLSTYRIDALRDAVLFAYGALAIIVAGLILSAPRNLARLLYAYRRFSGILLLAIPFFWLLSRFADGAIPAWPWSDVPMIYLKGGDPLVHMAGILGLWVGGFAHDLPRSRLWIMAGAVAVMGTYNRGGLLSFIAAFAVCIVLRPHDRHGQRMISVGIMGLLLLALTNVEFKLPGKDREISFMQLVTNVASVAGPAEDGNLDATKEWRLEWWGDIAKYTFAGPYFWTGKGFGVNLAEDDGYQVLSDNSLRSPHNGHLSVLARMGVPGIVLWVFVLGSWAWAVLQAYLSSERRRERNWAGLFLFLLVYWTAFIVNATFDVFLEGPMGGIWFWSLYGFGVAALWCYRRCPKVLPPLPTTA